MITVVGVEYQEQIFSPFSGKPADGEEGPNEKDESLQWIYYGDAGLFGYVSPIFASMAKAAGVSSVEEIGDPEDLIAKVALPNSLVFKVDTGWNGTNYYCFAAAEQPKE